MKKKISIILIMLICLLSLSSCGDDDIVFEFEKNSDLTCTLTGVKTNGQPIDVLEIPESYNHMPVTCIKRVSSSVNATKIILPSEITSISNYAFSYHNMLKTIDMSKCRYLTEIGSNAFEYCCSLTRIDIPKTVTSVGTCAFYECASLCQAVFENSETKIQDQTFMGCSKLQEIIGISKRSLDTDSYNYPGVYENIRWYSSISFSQLEFEDNDTVTRTVQNDKITYDGRTITGTFKHLVCIGNLFTFPSDTYYISNDIDVIDDYALFFWKSYYSEPPITTIVFPEGLKSIGKKLVHGYNPIFKYDGILSDWQKIYKGTTLQNVVCDNGVAK